MSKKPKKDKLSRDELLGFEKCFSLNQSEYVARKIIDQLLFLTYQQVRNHNVLALEEAFSVYRAMKTLTRAVSFSLIEPEEEYEKNSNYDISFELMPNRIDTWASNKAKILRNLPEEEIQPPPLKKPVLLTKPDKDNKESHNASITKRDSIIAKRPKLLRNIDKAMKKITAPREFNIESKPLHIETVVQYDEMDMIKLKGYRTYFQEKEIEDKKNKILEKVQDEKAKEEEKKIKQFTQVMNASSLLSWDSQGQFLPIKPVPLADAKDFLFLTPLIKDKKTVFDVDKVFTSAQSQINKQPGEEIIKDPQPPQEVRERYYQPDPLSNFDLAKGTSMEFYGKKKRGGHFDKGDGRLSHVEYMELLSQIHPYHFAAIHLQNKPQSVKNEGEVIDEEDNPELPKAKHQIPSFTRLYYMFRDIDDDKLLNNNTAVTQMKKEQEELLKNLSPRTTKELLKEIKKRQKEARIHKDKEFKLTEIDDVANEKIYDVFKYYHDSPETLIPFKATEKIRPPHVHDENKRTLGSTFTKLPRDRRKNDFSSKTSYDQNWLKKRLIQKDKEDKEKKKEEMEKKNKESEGIKLPSISKSNSLN